MPTPGIDMPGLGCGLAVLRAGKLLLYRRLRAPEAGTWNIVGGKVDHMERAMDAARREAEEESGLTIGAVDFLCISEQIIADERQHWLSLIYVCEDFTGEARVVEPGTQPFGSEIEVLPLTCFSFSNEVVVLHRPSRTLVVTDLCFNLPSSAPLYTRLAMRAMGGYPGVRTTLLERFGMQRAIARRELGTIASWDFDRLVLAHGDVVERGGKDAFVRAFGWLLRDAAPQLPAG